MHNVFSALLLVLAAFIVVQRHYLSIFEVRHSRIHVAVRVAAERYPESPIALHIARISILPSNAAAAHEQANGQAALPFIS